MLLCQAMFTAMSLLACPPAVAATLMHAATNARAVGGTTEADWIRWTGVAVGLVGAVVVAPSGSLVIIGEATAVVKRSAIWIRAKAARWIPWLRRDANVQLVPATLHLSAHGGVVSTGDATAYGGSLVDQVQQLQREIQRVRNEIGEVDQA